MDGPEESEGRWGTHPRSSIAAFWIRHTGHRETSSHNAVCSGHLLFLFISDLPSTAGERE